MFRLFFFLLNKTNEDYCIYTKLFFRGFSMIVKFSRKKKTKRKNHLQELKNAANTCICIICIWFETNIKKKTNRHVQKRVCMCFISLLAFFFLFYRKYLFKSIKAQSGTLFLCISLSHSCR